MELQTSILNGVMTVVMKGEFDEANARKTRDYLDENIKKYSFHSLILDMQGVEFMDSTGIGVLLGRYKKVKSIGAEIYVKNLNSQLDKVFRVSGLHQIIKAV